MPRSLRVLTGAVLGVAAIAAPVAAQGVGELRTVRFGAQGGLTMPTGDAGDFLGTGFTVAGTLDWRLVNRPFGLRFDVGYHRLPLSGDAKDMLDFLDIEADPGSVFAGTGAVVLAIPTTGAVRPYLLGGAGAYHLRQSYELPDAFGGCGLDEEPVERRGAPAGLRASRRAPARADVRAAAISCTESATEVGLHAGAGLGFPLGGVDAYVEARFHSIFTEDGNTNLVPIVLGLRF